MEKHEAMVTTEVDSTSNHPVSPQGKAVDKGGLSPPKFSLRENIKMLTVCPIIRINYLQLLFIDSGQS